MLGSIIMLKTRIVEVKSNGLRVFNLGQCGALSGNVSESFCRSLAGSFIWSMNSKCGMKGEPEIERTEVVVPEFRGDFFARKRFSRNERLPWDIDHSISF